MTIVPDAELTQLTVNLVPSAVEALDQAVKSTGDTKTDAVNRALRFYGLAANFLSDPVLDHVLIEAAISRLAAAGYSREAEAVNNLVSLLERTTTRLVMAGTHVCGQNEAGR